MTEKITPREATLKILYDIDKNNAYTNITLKKHLKTFSFAPIDNNFITELIYGIVKHRITIDYIIEQFSSIKIKKISPWILNILRMGIYQISFLDRVPDSAACNESVKLAQKYGHSSSARYVNGVLRNISRNKTSIKYPNREEDLIGFLSVVYSHPEWLIKEWINVYGVDFTESLCKANNERPDLSIRTNTLKISAAELIDRLKSNDIKAQQGKYHTDAVVVQNIGNIEKMDEYKEGLFYPQDESSMFVSTVVDPKPDSFVIDVCCAPGGKTTHMAQLMNNKGTAIGFDIHEHKISLVKRTGKRLGISIIEAIFHDATLEETKYIEKADSVLVDAPCSGLGIIRRKPDIKWNCEDKSMEDLVALQKRILSISSKYVKKGGILVYSTCTINDKENIEVAKDFLENNPDFELEDITGYFPDSLKKDTMKKGYVQFFPNVDGIDGFFICKMKRKEK